jgi:molybdopterin/thiamine biosynthesis adenylyltransferase
MSNRMELDFTPEDRYARLRLISWWDQDLLQAAKILVVGVGALGNEILKNLALLGVGEIFLVDMDRVELSNLSRSVLFRAEDEGKFKAEVAAARLREINPELQVVPIVGNINYEVGMGLFRHVDVVIGGLDNREARMAINRRCWLTNTPWIDGAIEALNGVARVFLPPEGPCYECTMTAADYRLLNLRRSCALLSQEEMLGGKTPTTPTTSAVIAGIAVQEAVKLVHRQKAPDLPVLAGKGFVFNGLTHDSYVVTYQERADCYAHEEIGQLVELPEFSAANTTWRQLLARVRAEMGAEAIVELLNDLVYRLVCDHCGREEAFLKNLAQLSVTEADCPVCGQSRQPVITHQITGDEPFLDCTLRATGVASWEILAGRVGFKQIYFELSGDRGLIGKEGADGDR